MRLDDARLCLDCEEIHLEQECPSCGSEAFAFLTRWIQSTTRGREEQARPSGRAVTPKPEATAKAAASRDELDAWRRLTEDEPDAHGRGRTLLTRGLMGLAAAGLAGWVWTKRGSTGGGSEPT